MMEFRSLNPHDARAIEELFVSVFSKSEGDQEGELLGQLVKELIVATDSDEVHGFAALVCNQIIGAVFFSRMTFRQPVEAFLLSPAAVESDHQGQGIGQALISHGLREMKRRGVRFVATYGDPAFYSKVGFRSISPDSIRPPQKLSQPEGWLGQPLTDESLETISGRFECVKAFDNPLYW